MNPDYIYYTIGSAICLFYIGNIIPILILRNKIFSSLLYIHSIVICIAFSVITMFIANHAAQLVSPCLLILWLVFSVGSVIGGNYVVKCMRIVIQVEWNHYYNRIFKLSHTSSSSSLSTSGGGDIEESKFTNLILKAVPLLRERNSLILFSSIILVGLSIPAVLNVSVYEYRNNPHNNCSSIDTISIGLLAVIITSYLLVIVISTVILIKRRKSSKNMYVVKHLKHIALSWIASLIVFIILNTITATVDSSETYHSVSTIITCLVFAIPFTAEIVLPQIQYFRDKKHMKRYERMREDVKSVGELIKISFSNTLKVVTDVEMDDKVVSKKKYLKDVSDCLRVFIIDNQRFQSELRSQKLNTSILLNKLHFIQMVNRSSKEDELSPGHVYKIWKIFFSPEESPSFNEFNLKIPKALKNERIKRYFSKENREILPKSEWVEFFLDNVDDWNDLYKRDNPIGELSEEFVKDIIRMENDALRDELAYERCSELLMEIYRENIEIMDEFVLEEFKESSYFHVMVESINEI